MPGIMQYVVFKAGIKAVSEIILVRHGAPDTDILDIGRIKAGELQNCVRAYDNAGILTKSVLFSNELQTLCRNALVVSSHLPRSIASAHLLTGKAPDVSDPIYREAELPVFNLPWFRTKPMTWVVINRIAWLLGVSANAESAACTRNRAKLATSRLLDSARSHSKVVLVGHGFINRYIARQLLHHGCKGAKYHGRVYWDYQRYLLD